MEAKDKQKTALFIFEGGVGDAVFSAAAARRAQYHQPDINFQVGAWTGEQEEIYRLSGLPVTRLPHLGLFHNRMKQVGEWPAFFKCLMELSVLLHTYDQVICPVGVGSLYHLSRAFKAFIPGDRQRFLPMPHPREVIVSGKYMGFILQDRIDALLGGNSLPYFPPELGFSKEHSGIADRMWAEIGLDPKRSVVCNFRTSNPTKDFTPSQVEFTVSFIQGHKLSSVIINYLPEDQELLTEKFPGHKLAFAANNSVLAMGEFLRMARAHVTADTGVAHIAGVVGTPTLVVFGPSDSKNWVYPGHDNVNSVQVNMSCKTLTCRAGQVCNHPEVYCMSHVDMDELAEKLHQVARC